MLQVKKKEGRNSTQGHELNKWIDNNTFFFKEKKKAYFEERPLFSYSQRCEYVSVFYQMDCPIET